jgi:hypothetical protein
LHNALIKKKPLPWYNQSTKTKLSHRRDKMNENEKQEPTITKDGMKMADRLLPFFEACPHIFKPGIGIEAFVEDLNRAVAKLPMSDLGAITAMNNLHPFIMVCPQIVPPGIGAEIFVEDLSRAADKFKTYFSKDLSRAT